MAEILNPQNGMSRPTARTAPLSARATAPLRPPADLWREMGGPQGIQPSERIEGLESSLGALEERVAALTLDLSVASISRSRPASWPRSPNGWANTLAR